MCRRLSGRRGRSVYSGVYGCVWRSLLNAPYAQATAHHRPSMRSHDETWEHLARDDAEYYILTEDVDFGTPQGQQHFYDSGSADANGIWTQSRRWMDGEPTTAVEIGCGIGRLTLPMARRLPEIRAIDVSPTMLRRLADNCAAAGLDSVRGFLPAEAWDTGRPVDFAYSRWVLQHIPDFGVIEGYVARLGACMRPGAVAHLQLDTRPATIGYRVRNALPDQILPRRWRRGVRRIRRAPAGLRALFARHGFSIAEELNPDSTDHVFVLVRR